MSLLRVPELEAVFQVGSYESRAKEDTPLPLPAAHTAFHAAQERVGFLGLNLTLLGHIQAFLLRDVFNPFSAQPVLVFGTAPHAGPCIWPR